MTLLQLQVFRFRQITHAQNLFLSMHSHENMSIRIPEHFIQSFMFIFNKIIKMPTEIQNFVKMYDSLKYEKS